MDAEHSGVTCKERNPLGFKDPLFRYDQGYEGVVRFRRDPANREGVRRDARERNTETTLI